MVWLVSHLKATCRRRTLTSQPPQWWRVPGAAEEEVSDPGPPSRRWNGWALGSCIGCATYPDGYPSGYAAAAVEPCQRGVRL